MYLYNIRIIFDTAVTMDGYDEKPQIISPVSKCIMNIPPAKRICCQDATPFLTLQLVMAVTICRGNSWLCGN